MSPDLNEKNIFLSIIDGRTIRDLIYNDIIPMLNFKNTTPIILSPISSSKRHTNSWNSSCNAKFESFHPVVPSLPRKFARFFRKYVSRKHHFLLNQALFFESMFYDEDSDVKNNFEKYSPSLILSTHSQLASEMSIIIEARRNNIPSVGMVRSWDNIFKGLYCRADFLTVWCPINQDEAVTMEGYSKENVFITGAPQFDQYFKKNDESRKDFCNQIGFDPHHPIITFATIGSRNALMGGYDETYLIDLVLGFINEGKIDIDTQLIIRLHPHTSLEIFLRYNNLKNVYVSYFDEYIPSLGWSMTNDFLHQTKNILNFSSVIVSPGSTMVIEAAIFDKPTLVPLFHPHQKRIADETYKRTYNKHFKRLIKEDLVKIQRSEDELLDDLKSSLSSNSWYSRQRKILLDDYVPYRDGKSTERLVDFISKVS
tara:strand:- start:5243 stop:6520 length:1278 start_codon:yes stop_codon:yes gene_type:complete